MNGAITRPSTITKTFRQPYPSYMQSFIKICGAVLEKSADKIMTLCNFNKDSRRVFLENTQTIEKVPRGGCVFTEKCSVFLKTKVVVLKVLKPDDFYVKYYFDWTNGWIEARIHLKLGNSCVLEATIQVLTSACNHEKTRPMLAKVQNRLKKISILVSFL